MSAPVKCQHRDILRIVPGKIEHAGGHAMFGRRALEITDLE
jgi:hypothetical protein